MKTHILPVDDLKEHKEEGISCWCEPKVETTDGDLLIIHNAADHREYFESDRKKAIN